MLYANQQTNSQFSKHRKIYAGKPNTTKLDCACSHRLSWLCYQARLHCQEARSDKIWYLVYCTWDKAPHLFARKQMGKRRRERRSSLHSRKAGLTNVITPGNSKYPFKLSFNSKRVRKEVTLEDKRASSVKFTNIDLNCTFLTWFKVTVLPIRRTFSQNALDCHRTKRSMNFNCLGTTKRTKSDIYTFS